MTGPVSADELRAQVQQVDADLERIRRTAAEIRADVGDAEDPTDRGSLIQAADEQDALAETLTARREDLLRKLAEADK